MGPPGSGKTAVSQYLMTLFNDKNVVYIDQDMFNGNLQKFTEEIYKLFKDPNIDIIINGKTNINSKARLNIPMPKSSKWKVLGVNFELGTKDDLIQRVILRETYSTVNLDTYTHEDIEKIISNFLRKYQKISTREKQFNKVVDLDFNLPLLMKAIKIKRQVSH
jgi:Cdc6-like AAA superfamily ATPase